MQRKKTQSGIRGERGKMEKKILQEREIQNLIMRNMLSGSPVMKQPYINLFLHAFAANYSLFLFFFLVQQAANSSNQSTKVNSIVCSDCDGNGKVTISYLVSLQLLFIVMF